MKMPKGFDAIIIEVALARSVSANQLLAMMLTPPVVMGEETPMIIWPSTIHQN